ncbi:MAG TPA: glycosyltransferase family 2 protein [Acidiferrobacteraceae bacterium]|nr:glycosyltransferase family 2 protein [Acidiferrobacteraceae bacterium]
MLDAIGIAVVAFQVFIFLYFVLLNGTYTIFTFIAMRRIRSHSVTASVRSLQHITGGYYKPVSIIVPAYNEAKTIVSSLQSLLLINYPEFEVVLVDDGSEDHTFEAVQQVFHLVPVKRPVRTRLMHEPIVGLYVSLEHPNLLVARKTNGGKADALNAGIDVSSYPLFCCVDADSMLEPDALLRAAKPFIEDREVVASGGLVRVLNGCTVRNGVVEEIRAPTKGLECIQAAEYTRGFLSGRMAWNAFGSLLIISGAFGVFRKDLVVAMGGYYPTIGEDMDLVVRMHRYCVEHRLRYKVMFVPEPVCWTQVPSDLHSLLRQRNRWHRGLVDTLWRNRAMFLNPRYGSVGLLGLPYFMLIEMLGPAIEFAGYVGFLILFLLNWIDPEFALLFLVVAVLWGVWINVTGVMLDNLIFRRYRDVRDILKLCLYGSLEFLGYRQLLAAERLIATFQGRSGWGHVKRHQIDADERPGNVHP